MILNELKKRGLEYILIISTDNLPRFNQAIDVVYAKTQIQKCIIHQIRSPTKYVSYKGFKELMRALKTVYKATSDDLATKNLDCFEEKWGK